MATAGVSGLAVGLTTAGGVFLVAAIKNQTPIDVIKAVLKQPTSGRQIGRPFGEVVSGVAQVVASAGGATGGAGAAVVTGPGAALGGAVAGAVAGGALVAEARRHLGAPYVWGAAGPNKFDCSGFVVYCLRKTILPNAKRFYTANVSAYLKGLGWQKVSPAEFRAGDIIIKTGHMGIAVSNDRMIAAPHPGAVVRESSIFNKSAWWGYRPR